MKSPHQTPHHGHVVPHRPHPLKHQSGHNHSLPSPTLRGKLARFIGRNWARVGYAYHIEPTWLEINRHDIPVKDLGEGFHGLKIAQLTDFHCGPQVPVEYLENALARTMAEKPDLIALTGDFIHKGYKFVAEAAKLCRHLKAPLGVFAVLGNHDFSVRNALGVRRHPGLHKAVAEALRAEGVKVLRNEARPFERNGAGLILAGVDDLWSRECDPAGTLAGACPNTPRVVLSHNPQAVELFANHRYDLMLSGHTHGGQVDWPGLGRVLLGKKAKRLAAGLYALDDGCLYVNKGVGFGWRFRFRTRPEVAVFTLRPVAGNV